MSKIKYTIVPSINVEDCIYESGVRLSDSYDIKLIDPVVIFNNNMELGIEEIYEGQISPDNIVFTNKEGLYSSILKANDKEFSNTIIINGFDIDLDYIRNNLIKISKNSDKIFSINVISDTRKYTNFTLMLSTDLIDELTDEEWETYKEEYNNSFEESLKEDVEENKIHAPTEEEAAKALEDFLKAFCGYVDEDDDQQDDEKDDLIPTLYLAEPKQKTEKESRYEAYSYMNKKTAISIEVEDDLLIFMDEKNEVIFPLDQIDFIIDILNKLK